MNAPARYSARLQPVFLGIVRVIFIILAAASISTFIVLIPLNLRGFIDEWQVRSAAHTLEPFVHQGAFAVYILVLRYVAAFAFFVPGVVIFWRKRTDWPAMFVAVTLVLLPQAFNLIGFTDSLWIYPAPWDIVLRVTRGVLTMLAFTGFSMLFFLFPDGRFVPRWMAVGAILLLVLNTTLMGSLLLEAAVDWPLIVIAELALLAIGIAGQVYRYTRVSGILQRQQTKWVLFGMVAIIVWELAKSTLDGLFISQWYAGWFDLASIHLDVFIVMLVPLTIAFSVLRYRLWDIDLVVNRALVYVILTAVVVGLYVLVVGVLSALFQAQTDIIVTVVLTGIVALLVQPLRAWLQSTLNRLMYGERDDPTTVLSRLGREIEAAVTHEALLPAIVVTVTQALRLPYACIALKEKDAFKIAASHGLADAHTFDFPLAYEGETVGYLKVAPRASGENLTPADRRLLQNIASQAGAVAHTMRLTADLQHSRERLVNVREEERRRLRRDLHDGLGPTLASQTLRLDAAVDLIGSDPAAARALLLELKKQTRAMITDIRRLVYELRPPALDELGLVSAVREHVTRHGDASLALQVTVESPSSGLPPLPAAVEVAAYRIVQEAMTNVVRHAHAHTCLIRFTHDNALHIEVADDGIGMSSDVNVGEGLRSIRERAAELGGACVVTSGPQGGTCVIATLPV